VAGGAAAVRSSALAIACLGCLIASAVSASGASALPPGFTESTTISGLELPTAVRFAPGGQVIVAEKSGLIKTFDNLSDPSATTVADLRTEVYNTWDRGLLGIALDPGFASNRFLYVLYTRNAKIGGAAPFWPTLDGTNDDCPGPVTPPDALKPGPVNDGCVASGRLVRLQLSPSLASVTSSQTLIEDQWCQQFPSHSIGSLAFDTQGRLYVSAGDGASFSSSDWDQFGIPRNPCGDPPGGVGAVLTPPSAEGGALRAQDLRTPADPTGLDGSVIRIDPQTGDPAAGNPLAGPDLNARRTIAYGFRNPFRIAIRPGTNELWVGDVGWGHREEIDRLPPTSAGIAPNFGWPCYEGAEHIYGVTVCQDLFVDALQPIVPPVFTYEHQQPVVSGDSCDSGSSSTSGLAFESSSLFPARYDGSLFFADYSRNCIWVMRDSSGDGVPDASAVENFRPGAGGPVDLQFGPGGALYYADIADGEVRAISYQGPSAVASADPDSGAAPLAVTLSGASSSDPDDPQDSLDFDWDLDGDGGYDDAHGITATHTYDSQGSYAARLRVRDPAGNEALDSVAINVANGPPVPTISAPSAGTLWRAGDTIAFSGGATDPEDGTLPATSLDWNIDLAHCPGSCHIHFVAALQDHAAGSFIAPQHEYPSHLELTLTATDSFGRTASTTRELDPRTSRITVNSSPPGLTVWIDEDSAASPLTRTEIVGSSHGIATSSPQQLGSTDWLWQSWSDGGALAHSVVAGDQDTEVTASFDTEQTLPAPPPPEPPSPEPETRSCMGVAATYVGTSDAEAIRGGTGDDSIVARGGDDTIRGRGGDDLICAGAGDDELRGGSGADQLRGGSGHDACPNPGVDKRSSCR
jgi:glucose/arabinose dehydrogenase/PKD repeat protein